MQTSRPCWGQPRFWGWSWRPRGAWDARRQRGAWAPAVEFRGLKDSRPGYRAAPGSGSSKWRGRPRSGWESWLLPRRCLHKLVCLQVNFSLGLAAWRESLRSRSPGGGGREGELRTGKGRREGRGRGGTLRGVRGWAGMAGKRDLGRRRRRQSVSLGLRSIGGKRNLGCVCPQSAPFVCFRPTVLWAFCPLNLKIQIRCPSKLSMKHTYYWEQL